jgi:hypothetical protein
MLAKDQWLDAVESWLSRYRHDLEGAGIVARLTERTRGHAKNSVSVTLDTESKMVEAIVWDTGEAEILETGKADSAPRVKSVQVSDPAGVAGFLDDAREALNQK